MPEPTPLPRSDTEDERIAKWRAERTAVAEQEKAARIAKREESQKLLEAERLKRRRDTARALLPDEDALIQADVELRRRQRRRTMGALVQFAALVAAPLICLGWYLTQVATPLYEARAVIAISKPAAVADQDSGGLLGALGGTSHLQEVFMAHEFIQSQAAMDALERKSGLVTTFSSTAIDPVQRLREFPFLAYSKRSQFDRFVHSTVDIQTGLLTVRVRAPERSQAIVIADDVLALAAAQINSVNDGRFSQRVALAQQSVSAAQRTLTDAQGALVKLQIESGEADPRARIAGVYETIRALEDEALVLRNAVERADVAGVGQSAQAQQTAALESRLRDQIDAERALLISTHGGSSLNAMLMAHEIAELNVRIGQEALTSALGSQAEAEQAAALGRSLFQVVVPPRTASQALYPETTTLMIFATIILLTAFSFVRLLGAGRRGDV